MSVTFRTVQYPWRLCMQYIQCLISFNLKISDYPHNKLNWEILLFVVVSTSEPLASNKNCAEQDNLDWCPPAGCATYCNHWSVTPRYHHLFIWNLPNVLLFNCLRQILLSHIEAQLNPLNQRSFQGFTYKLYITQRNRDEKAASARLCYFSTDVLFPGLCSI